METANSLIESKNDDFKVGFVSNGISYFETDYLNLEELNNSGIETLVVPKHVEVIEQSAFEGFENLKVVKFEDEDIILCRNAFYRCKNLKKVILGDKEYKAHCIQSEKMPYYKGHVMIVVGYPDIPVEDGNRVYELREFYPTMNGQGIVGGCYVKLNDEGEEIMISSQLSDFKK